MILMKNKGSVSMCTGIKVDYKDGSVMGRTMDFEVALNYNVIYLPKNYYFAKDLMGEKLKTKYKSLGVSFENRDPLKDGINEFGLIGITNEFTGFNLYHKNINKEKKNISSLNYLTYALSNYKSLEELVKDLPNIHMASRDSRGEKVISPDFHHMFTDSSKRCIVVEPKGKKLLYYENPYNVITNSPGFESHIKKLNKLIDLDKLDEFNSSKNLPGGYDPSSRFIKAFYLTKMNIRSETYKEGLSHFYNIMGTMSMPEGFVTNKKYKETTYTRYICGYDTKSKSLTIKSHLNPTVYEMGFQDIEDDKIRQEYYIENEFTSRKLKSNK